MPHVSIQGDGIEVQENIDTIWTRIASAEEGIMQGANMVAPPGWISLMSTTSGSFFAQAACIGYVRP